MGKRSDFERRDRDAYDTPMEAVIPLLPHLAPQTGFSEPCAGNAQLIGHLEKHGHWCVIAHDIEPRTDLSRVIHKADATWQLVTDAASEIIITNPPWTRDILHQMIMNLSRQQPTWLLFDADWVHTRQAAPYLPRLRKIVSVGRVKWIPESKMTGKDNCAWHLFDRQPLGTCQFFGRANPSTGL